MEGSILRKMQPFNTNKFLPGPLRILHMPELEKAANGYVIRRGMFVVLSELEKSS